MTEDGAGSSAWAARPGILAASWPCSDDGVVFDAASGDTHRLDPVAFEILLTLSERPLGFEELVSTLFDADEAFHANDGRHQAARALRLLETLRLIQGSAG